MGKKTTKVSPFWKPSVAGDVIEGLYAGMQTTQAPGKDKKKGVAIVLLLKNGTKLVPASHEIHSTLDDRVSSFKVGKTRLRFVYLSTEKTNSGFRVKKFDCYVDGKLIPAKGAFQTATEVKAVKEVWGSVGKPV